MSYFPASIGNFLYLSHVNFKSHGEIVDLMQLQMTNTRQKLKSFQQGKKTLWEKEKMQETSMFFSTTFSKSLSFKAMKTCNCVIKDCGKRRKYRQQACSPFPQHFRKAFSSRPRKLAIL